MKDWNRWHTTMHNMSRLHKPVHFSSCFQLCFTRLITPQGKILRSRSLYKTNYIIITQWPSKNPQTKQPPKNHLTASEVTPWNHQCRLMSSCRTCAGSWCVAAILMKALWVCKAFITISACQSQSVNVRTDLIMHYIILDECLSSQIVHHAENMNNLSSRCRNLGKHSNDYV